MKKGASLRRGPGFLANLAITTIVVAVLALAGAKPAAATLGATSAGATIHNVVKVEYKLSSSSTVATTVYSAIDVTVLTVPTTATWYPSTPMTVTGGTTASYTSTVLRSNANGPDQYTIGNTNGANTYADAQSAQNVPANLWLWGGITAQAAAADTLYFPGGSVNGGLIVGNTIEITVAGVNKRYNVTAISTGSANTQDLGTNELLAEVTVIPVTDVPSNHVGPLNFAIPSGTQIGQYTTVSFDVTVGNPTTPGTIGQNITNLSAVGVSRDAAANLAPAALTSVTTNITSLMLSIAKTSRILPTASPLPGANAIDTTLYTIGTKTAKATEIVEYLIAVTNPSGNSTASSVVITDPTPAYTAFVSNSQSIGTAAIGTSTVPATSVSQLLDDTKAVWSGSGYTYTSPLPGNSVLYIVYQVTVN